MTARGMRRVSAGLGYAMSAVVLLSLGCSKTTEGSSDAPPAERPRPAPFEVPPCAATAQTTADCVDDPTSALCPGAAGYAFLQPAIWSDPERSATLSVPEPGKVCVSGFLPAPLQNEFAEIDLNFFLSRRDETLTCILSPFDASSLDISALQFDLDRVPDTWFVVGMEVIREAQCEQDPAACTKGGIYDWLTPDRQEIVALASPGTIVVPLDELVGDDLPDPIHAHWFSGIVFYAVVGYSSAAVEFCVSNIKFLDSTGQEVIPPPLP
jgi:hypothetical protein